MLNNGSPPSVTSTDAPDLGSEPGPEDVSWEYLLHNELPRTAAFLRTCGATPDEARECAVEALAQCWARRTSINFRTTYLRKVAYSVFLKRPAQAVPLDETHTDPPDAAPSPCTQAENNEGNQTILAMLNELPPTQRMVMAYRLDGYEPAEIAVEMQSTPQAVRTNLNRARNTLKSRLAHLGKDRT